MPDVLRFCDAFELRPALLSTREVLDAFKEVCAARVWVAVGKRGVGIDRLLLGRIGRRQKYVGGGHLF